MRDSCSGSTLAIIEKEPTTKPGGCIGVFLHLFDWKKKKQFTRKLLPPVNAAKRALKRLGGQDKFTVAKQLLVSQESREGSCSYQVASAKEMCAPTMIARLMGLESMPNVHHEHKQVECRKVCSKSKTLLKTTTLLKNRRSLGKDAFRLEMGLEEQHRVASVFQSQRRSARRRKARLREVATRILEPGLQSRNASKFGITNFDSSVKIAVGSDMASRHDLDVGSCANCGSLVKVMNLRVNGKSPGELDDEYRGPSSSSSSSSNFEATEESLGRRVMQGCKKNPSVRNSRGRFSTRNDHGRYRTHENVSSRKNQLASRIQNHSSDSEANVIAGASSNSSGHRTLVIGRTRTGRGNATKSWNMKLDKYEMIARRRPVNGHHIACDELSSGEFLSQKSVAKELPMRKIAGSVVSHPKDQSSTRNESVEDIKSTNGSKKVKQRISLTFSSGRRHVTRSTSQLDMVERNKCFNKLIGGTSPKDSLLVNLKGKLSHLQGFEQNNNFQTDDCFLGINSLSLSRTSSFQKNNLCSAGYLDFSHQTFTDEQTAKINQKIQENAKSRTRVKSISCGGETDVSSVEASASSDSCRCQNHNRRSGFKQEMEGHSPENCTKMEERNAESDDSETLVDINRLNSSKLPATTGSKLFKHGNYLNEAQEALRNGMQDRAKCNVVTMLAEGDNPQRQLLLDCMVESLDSLYDYFCHKNYEAFFRYRPLSTRRLAELVEEKIIRWQHMESKSLVELTKQEIQQPTNIDWPELMTGRIELSKNIEEDTLYLMINELVVDLFHC